MTRTKVVGFRVSDKEHKEIKEYCEKTGQTSGSLGRRLTLQQVRQDAK